MTSQKKHTDQLAFLLFQTLKARHQCGWGIWVLIGTLLLLSLIAGANFETAPRVYVAGQVAENDVIADRDILVEDTQATRARKSRFNCFNLPCMISVWSHIPNFRGG